MRHLCCAAFLLGGVRKFTKNLRFVLLKHLSTGTQLDEYQYAIADVNGDGNKDMLDVIAILNMAS